jgi:ATP-dependent helicase/nuclease subunit A
MYETILGIQKKASNPFNNVWVTASAGSGKTKVLVDRILKLLLVGSQPSAITSITFSQNGAREMEERLYSQLKSWAYLSTSELKVELTEWTGEDNLSEKTLSLASNLWTTTQDTPVNICTIHSFCHNLLKKYISKYRLGKWEILNETSEKEIIQLTLNKIFEELLVQNVVSFSEITKYQFDELIEHIVSNKSYLRFLLADKSSLVEKIDRFLKSPTEHHQLKKNIFAYLEKLEIPTREALDHNSLTQKDFTLCSRILDSLSDLSNNIFDTVFDIFLTKDGKTRKVLLCKKASEHFQNLSKLLKKTADFLFDAQEEYKNYTLKNYTLSIVELAELFFTEYQKQKDKLFLLDYDDLILETIRLFSDEYLPQNVMYDIQNSINHLLIDEAQDTNLFQWKIILSIINFLIESDHKTLFVVGDHKQSIFSFQGADPSIFQKMLEHINLLFKNNSKTLHVLNMNMSFRSNQEILEFVDKVFIENKLITPYLNHFSYKRKGGAVTIFSPPDVESNPITFVAESIKNLIYPKEKKEEKKIVSPSDILILVRKRGEYLEALQNELNNHSINCSSPSRPLLFEDLLIQELCFSLTNKFQVNDDWIKFKLEAFNQNQKKELCSAFSLNDFILNNLVLNVNLSSTLNILNALKIFDTLQGSIKNKIIFSSFSSYIENLELTQPAFTLNGKPTNTVRIMTVHAAKGLQAPIVCLVDTVGIPSNRHQGRIVYDKHHQMILASPNKLNESRAFEQLKELSSQDMLNEYYRLLYVALTRAENALYIFCSPSIKIHEKSWYSICTSSAHE